MAEDSRPSVLQIIAQFIRSFIACTIKGPFYLYLLSVFLFLLAGFLIIFFSLGGMDAINTIIQFLKPLLVSLGVPESGTFSCKGNCINNKMFGWFILLCSIAGFIGTKLIEWWKKTKLDIFSELKLLGGLAIAANMAISMESLLFSLAQKDSSLPGSLLTALVVLVSFSFFALIGLGAYAVGHIVESARIGGQLSHEEYLKMQERWAEHEKYQKEHGHWK